MRKNIILILVVASLVIINLSIMKKEKVLESGEQVYIKLAPRDPRSLIQGDYMVLRYLIPQTLNKKQKEIPRKGFLVLLLNEKKVGVIKRLYKPGEKLATEERLIQYRVRSRGIRIGAESFFFQEGHRKPYEVARYGELRLTKNGHSVLVGLRNDQLIKIIPKKAASQ